MTPLHLLALLTGAVLVAAAAVSITSTLVIPRGVQSRIVRLVIAGVGRPWVLVSRRIRDYGRRDAVLAPLAPLLLLAELAAWLLLYLTGYALIVLAVSDLGLPDAYLQAGSAMTTLGAATAPNRTVAAVDLVAGVTGLVVVAMLVSYLPSLYAAYNRRETEVTLLQSRAGLPAWGPELLARHQLVGIMDDLPGLYRDWERWAADLAESHTNYPLLMFFRSPKPLRSWLVALLAVMDSAALYLARCPDSVPSQARLCVRMGFVCLRDLADALRIDYDPDPSPDTAPRLTYDEFVDAWQRLDKAGMRAERSVQEAWPHFRGWRVNYESVAYALADRIDAPPALWSGSRSVASEPIAPLRPVDRRPGDEPDVEAFSAEPLR